MLCADQPQDPLRQAQAALQSGDMGGAIRLYREFLKTYPDAAEIRSNLGAALVQDGQFAAAVTEYNIALQRLPNNRRIRMNLALAYYKLGQLPEAEKHLELLYQSQPLDVKAVVGSVPSRRFVATSGRVRPTRSSPRAARSPKAACANWS